MKVLHRESGAIAYRLHLLGIRGWREDVQLIAKWREDEWTTIGPRRHLPLKFPLIPSDLSAAANDTLCLTAYQYDMECPGSDLRAVLALEKDFETATEISVAAGAVPI